MLMGYHDRVDKEKKASYCLKFEVVNQARRKVTGSLLSSFIFTSMWENYVPVALE